MFFENLKENYDKLSISEQQVIDFLMKQPAVETTTLKKIKQEVLVSSSTVIRACKKLGYNTFNDLRYDIRLSKELEKSRIFCIGSGSSYMVVADFNRKLKLVDLWANDYFELYSIQRIPEISTDKDVIITFSLGGASKEINESILSAKQNGTKILTVTSLTASPLAKISDQIINIYDAPKARKKIRSRLMLNVVAIILFEIIVSKLNNK